MVASILGNFMAAAIARWIGYRRTIAWMFLGYFVAISLAYCDVRNHAGHALVARGRRA